MQENGKIYTKNILNEAMYKTVGC